MASVEADLRLRSVLEYGQVHYGPCYVILSLFIFEILLLLIDASKKKCDIHMWYSTLDIGH